MSLALCLLTGFTWGFLARIYLAGQRPEWQSSHITCAWAIALGILGATIWRMVG